MVVARFKFIFDIVGWVIATWGPALSIVFVTGMPIALISGIWMFFRECKREPWRGDYPTRLDFWLTFIFFATALPCMFIIGIVTAHFHMVTNFGLE
jgi:hypothetical protein